MSTRADRVKHIVNRILSDEEEHAGNVSSDLLRLWRDYLRPYRSRLILSFIVTIFWSAQPFGFALTSRFLVDDVLKVEQGFPAAQLDHQVKLLWVVIGINAGIWVVYLCCHWLRSWLINATGHQLVYELRRQLHEKLQALHVGFYERTPTGRIMSRVLDDVRVIQQWSTAQFVNLIAYTAKLAIGIGILIYFNWRLTILVALSLPLYAYSFYRLRPQIKRTNIALRRLNSGLYGLAAEKIGAIRVVKAFCRERGEVKRFARSLFEALRVHLRLVLYQQGLALIAGAVTALTTGVIIYLAMQEVRNDVITLGVALAFASSLPAVYQPVNALTTMITDLQRIYVVLRRVFSLLDEEIDVEPGAIRLQGMSGKVRFINVTFSYPDQAEPALHEADFAVQPGTHVAVMGPSGAGKSTLFNLLMRFYDPQQGEVRVGGVNLADADPGSIRRHVVTVQQEPTVFSGTIADNIMYGRLEATPGQVMEAATRAELHEFVMSLPHKYETEVGEGGVTLSGGQKQRLALATALLTDPEVLLLDDTTSALDANTEARIRVTLTRVLKGRTSLIITQRAATARDCDWILVLEDGRITQRGTHDELIQEQGFYRNICEQQEL